MKRTRRLSLLTVLVVVLAVLAPAGAVHAAGAVGGKSPGGDGPLCWLLAWGCDDDSDDDDQDDDRDEDGVVVAAPAPTHLIQGVAVDADGKGVDNVAVQALDAGTGKPVATALTYASARATGAQHGYFYLWVDRGVYDVVLVKRGYDASFLTDVNVTGRKPVSLGELRLELRDWPTSTVAEVLDPVVAPRQSVKVAVAVDSKKAKVTGGRLVVLAGKKVLVSQRLTKADRGAVTLDLGRMPRGTHRLTVEYRGIDGLRSSKARTLQVVVAKSGASTRSGR
jgi:hypothetical protein